MDEYLQQLLLLMSSTFPAQGFRTDDYELLTDGVSRTGPAPMVAPGIFDSFPLIHWLHVISDFSYCRRTRAPDVTFSFFRRLFISQ